MDKDSVTVWPISTFQRHILAQRLTVIQDCLLPASGQIVSCGKTANSALRHRTTGVFQCGAVHSGSCRSSIS